MVILFGVIFSLFTSALIWLEYQFTDSKNTSEQFNTAGRTVKTGLIANVICSQWTWAATVLQSSNVAWQYGVSGPFWYASGATIQIILFGILAVEIKRKAPNAHTLLEIIRARWGNTAHKVTAPCHPADLPCLHTNLCIFHPLRHPHSHAFFFSGNFRSSSCSAS